MFYSITECPSQINRKRDFFRWKIFWKKLKKSWKKVLTSEKRCGKITKLSRKTGARGPWKLNNTKKAKNETQPVNFLHRFGFRITVGGLTPTTHASVQMSRDALKKIKAATAVLIPFFREFDPGSGRTLAACLTHASRTESIRWSFRMDVDVS